MANQLSGPVITVDTPSANALFTDWVFVKTIRWVTGGALGDQAIVQNAAGKPVWSCFAPGTDFSSIEKVFPPSTARVQGLKVPTLSSGILYIEIG